MATGRPELLALLRGRLARGEVLPHDQVDGLITLCADLIAGARQDRLKIERLEQGLKNLDNLQKGLAKTVSQIRDVADRIQKNLPLPEPEDA